MSRDRERHLIGQQVEAEKVRNHMIRRQLEEKTREDKARAQNIYDELRPLTRQSQRGICVACCNHVAMCMYH